MALSPLEVWSNGYVRYRNSGAPVVTTSMTSASWQGGFLRDPDGRLVIRVA